MFHCGISADEILHCIFSLYLVYFFPPSLFRTLLSPQVTVFCFILLVEFCLVRGMWVFRRTFISRRGGISENHGSFRIWFCLVLEICFFFSLQFGLFHIFLQGN